MKMMPLLDSMRGPVIMMMEVPGKASYGCSKGRFVAVPRVLEKLHSQLEITFANTSGTGTCSISHCVFPVI
jgi:hypothetical protein